MTQDGEKMDEEGRVNERMDRWQARHERWRRRPRWLRVAMFLGFVAVAVTVVGLVVMALWNALVPAVFAGPQVSWLQALGLFALGRLLFGRWGRGGGHFGPRRWRGRWRKRMASLSPEERARLKGMLGGDEPAPV